MVEEIPLLETGAWGSGGSGHRCIGRPASRCCAEEGPRGAEAPCCAACVQVTWYSAKLGGFRQAGFVKQVGAQKRGPPALCCAACNNVVRITAGL